MHNFMHDLSHMMDDKDISPEERLEQYSDSKYLKELRKEYIQILQIHHLDGEPRPNSARTMFDKSCGH